MITRDILNDLQNLIRNQGKSNMIHKDEIQNIIDDWEKQIKEQNAQHNIPTMTKEGETKKGKITKGLPKNHFSENTLDVEKIQQKSPRDKSRMSNGVSVSGTDTHSADKIEKCMKCGELLFGCTWDYKSSKEHKKIEDKFNYHPLCERCAFKLKSKGRKLK